MLSSDEIIFSWCINCSERHREHEHYVPWITTHVVTLPLLSLNYYFCIKWLLFTNSPFICVRKSLGRKFNRVILNKIYINSQIQGDFILWQIGPFLVKCEEGISKIFAKSVLNPSFPSIIQTNLLWKIIFFLPHFPFHIWVRLLTKTSASNSFPNPHNTGKKLSCF